MSEEMAMLSGRGIRADSSAHQQQGITVDNHGPHMSIDELLKVLKGSNSTPVLLIPYGEGRLSAIAMNGVQSMVTTNHEVSGSTEKKQQDLHAWLLLVMSLAAAVTFSAGLTPPGGFWSADDTANHVAGTSVMRDKFPRRYRIFQYSNSLTFFFSMLTIGMLAKNIVVHNRRAARKKEGAAEMIDALSPYLVSLCFVFLGTSYISGTWDSRTRGIYNIVLFVVVLLIMFMQWVLVWHDSFPSGEQTADTNNS